MEWLEFIQIIAVPVIGYMVWQMQAIKQDVNQAKRDQDVYKVHVAEKYLSKDEAEKSEAKIYKMLENMNGKLDRLIEKKDA